AGRPYVSHLRGNGPGVRAGLGGLVAVGAGAGGRGPASHLGGGPADFEAGFGAAAEGGGGVTLGIVPFRMSGLVIGEDLRSPEAQAEGPERTLAALTDPGQRAALLDGGKLTESYLRNVYLGTVPGDLAGLAGLSVAEAAARDRRPPGEWALDLLVAADLNVGG